MPRINSDIPLQALIKRFSFIYLPIATLLTIILLLAVRFDNDLRIERTKVREASRIEVATGRIKQDLSAVETDLRIIASLPVLQTYLDHGSSIQRAELEKYFLVMARESRRYDQIRYLNTSGQEVIRINYNNGQPVIVQHAQLENKSGRYYFRESIKLNQGEVFISPLDLNIEQDRLEIPYKPMIRYGAAVFDSAGHKQGIVLINYLGNELLQNFRQVMQGGDSPDGVLLNHDGFWLASDNRDDEWGFMLGKKERTFGHDFPEVWQTLSSSDRGSLLTNQGLFVYATVSVLVGVQHVPADFGSAHSDSELEHEHSADWKIVTFVPNSVFSAASLYNLPGSRILMVAAYLLLALGSFFVARVTLSRQQARQEILQLNVELEKRAAAHAEGEENLSVTLNSIGDAVIATDIEGRVTRMNRVAEQLTGWLRAEAIGHPVADIFHIINQHTRQPATIPVSTTLAQGVIQGLANDTLLLARDGRECAIADSCAPIRQRDGKVIGAVLVFRDVTSEYTAQSALRDSEERYRTLFEQMDEGFCVVEMLYDSNGKATDYRFIEINPMFEKQTGLREALGKTIRQLVPDHDAHWFEIYGEVARTGTAIRFENPANAMQRYYDVFAFRIGGDGSRRVGILFKDITENNLAQKALNDSATRIQTILNTVADGIITINQHGIVEMFNPAAEHLFGYAASEVIGQNVKMLMPEPYHSQHDGYLQHYLTTGEVRILGTSREVVGLRRDGSTFPMYLAINNMKLGEQYYFTGVVHDLSASKQAEKLLQLAKEKAELANRAKDSFLATMSHEIRTPLTGMLGMLEVLSLTPLNHDQEETLRAAWDSSRSLLRIVSDILDWSKIEAGKLHLAPLSTSIPQLLQEVINTYSRVASAKSLVLRQIVDARLSRAHIVDGLRLSQVLNNFISNAIKFTHSGEIELRAELLDQIESGERIRFSVKDTGIGIARDAQHRLFRRYQQESIDTARRFGGTGLGLAICQSLVDMMDGQIDLVSVPGEGSVFSITLTLPVSGMPETGVYIAHPEVEQRPVKPLFEDGEEAPIILAVDDHPINRDLLARQIKLLGLRADTASNGGEALLMWQDRRYALIITDCHMPEMDGYALTRAIRKHELESKLPRTPVIAWTANALAEEEEQCRAAGMDDLLVKPAHLAKLRQTLVKWLAIADTECSKSITASQDEDRSQLYSPVDYALLAQVETDRVAQIQVLQDFMSHIRADQSKLRDMLAQSDLSNVVSTAHRMKGSCRMLGAKNLVNATAAIEQAARNGDLAGARSNTLVLDEAIGRFEMFIMEKEKTHLTRVDIHAVNFLVVEDDDFQRRMVIKMLRSLGAQLILEAENGKQAIKVMNAQQQIPVDIVICDLNMPEMDGLEFLRYLGELQQTISIVIISALGGKLLASAGSMVKMYGMKLLGVIEKPIILGQLQTFLSKYTHSENKGYKPVVHINFTLDEIMQGIHAKQFEPYFQPKVDLNTGRLVGAEVLARWVHPAHGVISPYAFIPLLELNEKIDDLTFLMLEKAAQACRVCHDKGLMLTVSVNLSLVSLGDTALADKITRVVRDTGLDSRYVILEITETAAMTDVAHALENLARLCMNGFALSIDDYGTGYSSMQQLTRIPFSELKIDQAFVHDFAENEALRIVVESSINMAHRLKVKSVAEGVETQQEWNMLKLMGCDTVQGYFIAKPMDLKAFQEFMKSYNAR